MPFAATDQERIADALELSTEQYRAGSVLAQLMSQVETNDTKYSTDFAGKITAALDEIECLNTEIDAAELQDGISSISIANQYSETFRSNGTTSSGHKNNKLGQIELIKRFLDPDGYLERFIQSGRVIRTL